MTSLSLSAKARLVAEVVGAYARARCLLGRRPLPEVVAALRTARAEVAPERPDAFEQGRRLARATVRTLALLPADDRCLMRSLVLTQLLDRRGLASELVLSASVDEGFLAHAWVEYAGRPLLEPGGNGHRTLLRV